MTVAVRAYARVATTARATTADPHLIITMLFDEALADLARAERAIETCDLAAKSRYLSHAVTLVAALDASLDHERGGEIARNLASVYAFVRARILRASARNDVEQVRLAAASLGEIAGAWKAIA